MRQRPRHNKGYDTMKAYNTFNRSLLARSISILLGTGLALPVLAQEDDVETIQVTGIRGSIQESMGIKRESSGVVDAISAEDIGKFPDTNLAESLQRITGVSIDRSNGEGSKITVRGFGPEFNLVTLNGRAMPAASLPGGGGVPGSRSFDFADLASEGVKTIEVYKTGKANVASGGVGATVNLVTRKPFDAVDTGLTASIGGKALHDTTNRVGDDVTPEISTFVNWLNNDSNFGITFVGSFQQRDSSRTRAFVNQWRVNPFDGSYPQSPNQLDPNAPGFNGPALQVNNAPAMGQLFAIPSDLRYAISDFERERTNAQLTVQFAPNDKLEATLDYTYSEQDVFQARAEQSIWMDDRYFAELTFDDAEVKTPIMIRQERRDLLPRDLGLAIQEQNQINENKSFGLNLVYYVNDSLTVSLDAHDSEAEGRPNAPYGVWTNLGLGANIVAAQGVDFSGEFPVMMVDFNDSDRGNLNPNGVLDQADVGTSILDMQYAYQKTDITQVRLDAEYVFDNGSIDFGIESRSMESTTQQALTRQTMGNWGIENPGELPAGVLTPVDFKGLFDDFDTSNIFNQGFTGSVGEIGPFAAQTYGFEFATTNPLQTDRSLEEDITAVYVQANLEGELGDMPFDVVAGVRYENTDVTSNAVVSIPIIVWEGNNDFNVRVPANAATDVVSFEESYDHVLPNLDFKVEVTDEIVARMSYSKTITRAPYGPLSASSTVGTPSGPSILAANPTVTASSGNPGLVPFESDNFDVSVEYYFDETSYVSIGYYEKRVDNFIGTQQVEENVLGIRDVTAGPRGQAALAELERQGIPVSDTNLFNMVVAMENGIAFDSLSDEEFEQQFDVMPSSDDPLMVFINGKPDNSEEKSVSGFEIAAQHFFGDTGFGVMANYTTVSGDINFDVNADPSVTQFPLVGASDTANLVVMYEKDQWQARVAYNWRDDFLDNQAQFRNEPSFTESTYQLDFNVSYEVNEQLTVFLEGINITEENKRRHGRTAVQLWELDQFGARYAIGARYKF